MNAPEFRIIRRLDRTAECWVVQCVDSNDVTVGAAFYVNTLEQARAITMEDFAREVAYATECRS